MKRAIVVFPEFENGGQIEDLRSRYDPLVAVIPAHITLVFPFESELTTEQLFTHVSQATDGIQPFAVKFQGITGHEGDHLFLNIKQGNDPLIELHDRLYTGMLSAYHSPEYTYMPHLTVGRLSDRDTFLQALGAAQKVNQPLQATVSEVSVYRLGGNDPNPIELRVNL